jgi:phosphatidylglycerol---prolipoprotein diacylglyceryl transferase
MFPILFTVGGFEVHTYGAMGALGFLVGCAVDLVWARRFGWDGNRVVDVIFWGALGALLGSRLVFVLQNPGAIHGLADFFNLRGGGLVFYGAFFVGPPIATALMYRAGLPVGRVWDVFGCGLPIAHALSRVGCYAAGCCYGAPTDGPLGVTYPADNPLVPSDHAVHPVQLYEVGALLLIGLVTNLALSRRPPQGTVFLLYVGLYAVARAILEAFRGDAERGLFLPGVFGEAVSFSQGISAVFGIAALAAFAGLTVRAAGQGRPA